jgi:hypothetical protein
MSDTIDFKDLGNKDIPDKGEIREEKMEEDITRKIVKEEKEKEIRNETGTEPEQKGSFTKDVPQLAFRIIGDMIPCPKFYLSDEEARIFAAHLNILIPVQGKIASLVVIIMISLNKVYACLDAIKRRSQPKMANEEAGVVVEQTAEPTRINRAVQEV